MRKLASFALALGVLTSSALGMAQQRRSNDVRQFYLNKDSSPAVSAANNARARARSGDCKGALDPFDTAIRYWHEPTLRRDRGLCHEQLGNPYPAIGDYRAYLEGAPNAPDYDQIKERLERLEAQFGETTSSGAPPEAKTASAASGNVVVSTEGASSSSSGYSGEKDKPRKRAKWEDERESYNSLFVELLGNAGIYSINYDRMFSENFSFRLGFSYVYYGASASSGNTSVGGSAHLFSIPVLLNVLIGSASHKAELGAGATILASTATVAGATSAISGSATGSGVAVLGTGVIGYRYAPQDGGFMMRVGFVPLIGGKPVQFFPWVGVSAGYQF